MVEPTKVTTKAGVTRNGTLRFTVLPPQNVIAHTMRKNWQNWNGSRSGRLRPPNVPRCEGLGALSRGRAESLPHHGLTERYEPITMALRRRKNRAG